MTEALKKSGLSEERTPGMLKQHGAGVKTAEVCSQDGILIAMFYPPKSQCGGMDVKEAEWLEADGGREPWSKASSG